MSIRANECDAAIVGGSNLCLKPEMALKLQNLGMLSEEGMCRSFDNAGKTVIMYTVPVHYSMDVHHNVQFTCTI